MLWEIELLKWQMTSVHNYRKYLPKFQFFSIGLDESKDIRDVAQVAVFFHDCDNNARITEELLKIIHLQETTTGEDIFDAKWGILEKCNFPLARLVSVITHCVSSMMGESKEFVSFNFSFVSFTFFFASFTFYGLVANWLAP
ncbi:general transcription factor II-I repeat domain-containing protein 2 [Caerostris darwini]|uniref:General transcription factor II-I repeat domain-containing protein 2 n=1 Tax=Caerostris darwini TaxID=1538125 RepID=A0AAV4WWH4_9ARAC|nr:general transcription factor II-I repeat domain-containing protein 2 [Caerostris darwini]